VFESSSDGVLPGRTAFGALDGTEPTGDYADLLRRLAEDESGSNAEGEAGDGDAEGAQADVRLDSEFAAVDLLVCTCATHPSLDRWMTDASAFVTTMRAFSPRWTRRTYALPSSHR